MREAEKLSSSGGKHKKKKPAASKKKIPDVLRVEAELKEVLGTRVSINKKGNKGKIEIEYYSSEELERLIEMLKSLR